MTAACESRIPQFEPSPMIEAAQSYDLALVPGDRLAVSFFRSARAAMSGYRLQRGDELSFSVLDQPDLNFDSVVVLPDGSATFPVVGAIPAAGQTVDELRMALAGRFEAALFRDPQISIVVRQSETETAQALAALAGSQEGEGTPLLVTVPPSRHISLPLLGRFEATELAALEAAVADRLRGRFGDQIGVTINASDRARRVVYVMGEVLRQGPVVLDGPLNPLGAIAAAGGLLISAAPEHTVLARYSPDGQIRRWKLDIAQALLDGAAINPAFSLASNDLIYVPPSDVAVANNTVELYIRRMLPFNVGVGAGVTVATLGE